MSSNKEEENGLTMNSPFFNLYSHDFARVAVAIPRCRIADPAYNVEQTIVLARQAAEQGAALVAVPELGLSAYSCDDLFHQRALVEQVVAAVGRQSQFRDSHQRGALLRGLARKHDGLLDVVGRVGDPAARNGHRDAGEVMRIEVEEWAVHGKAVLFFFVGRHFRKQF